MGTMNNPNLTSSSTATEEQKDNKGRTVKWISLHASILTPLPRHCIHGHFFHLLILSSQMSVLGSVYSMSTIFVGVSQYDQ
jgi:hypothetical protein